MSDKADKEFYQRASELIEVANKHNQDPELETGAVSASFMYALCKYNAWFSSTGFANKEQMQSKRDAMLKYYTEEYAKLLAAHMDDYIENFDHYRSTQK
ncbi:DUF3144 domain-containing protein [Ferrimonas senticii]|uniref:DUF3144 domain-containing protein n=1 Tax=Ferrimonas senticii TaxID=394566 RepID=UPI0004060BDB|nr:DUF3144 domain-containing protein [Ferrimonas senticii]